MSDRFRRHLLTAPEFAGRVDEGKVVVIPNRVDLKRFDPAFRARDETRMERGYDRSVVGVFAGSTSKWHRLDLTAEIMKLVMDERPDVRFVAAVYPSTDEAGRLVRERGLPEHRVELLTVCVEDIPRLFAACDFGLSIIDGDVSKQVCAPIKFGEYLASGLPVVAGGGVGDARDWLEDEGPGILIDPDDVAESARRVLDFLRSDAFVSGRLRGRARAFAAGMDMSDTIDQYEDVYRSLDPR